jgi:hypothetical protein
VNAAPRHPIVRASIIADQPENTFHHSDKRDALQQTQPFPFARVFGFVLFDEFPNEAELAANLRVGFRRVKPQT